MDEQQYQEYQINVYCFIEDGFQGTGGKIENLKSWGNYSEDAKDQGARDKFMKTSDVYILSITKQTLQMLLPNIIQLF